MPVILDLFSGAGGAAMGYHRAGFEVIGVDLAPQPRYPFEFIQADWEEAFHMLAGRVDAIHASPPCQRYSSMTKRWNRSGDHPDLVDAVRDACQAADIPYVIENVSLAPLQSPTVLCGSHFDLKSGEYGLRRHRGFEASFPLASPPPCNHYGQALPVYGHAGGRSKRDGLKFPGTDAWREGMGIDWMTGKELAEAIPPAFTEWVGHQLAKELRPCPATA